VTEEPPTSRQLKALSAARDYEDGKTVHLNLGVAEECCDLGWLRAERGGYILTQKGRSVLAEHTL
jgi:hypothetical protein